MLPSINDVVTKLDLLKDYSVAADPATEAFFTPVYAATDVYFSGDNSGLSSALTDVVKYMYNDIARRKTVYEFAHDANLATDYPDGYDDLSKCFYQFAELLSLDEGSFFNAFVYGAAEGDAAETPLGNPYLTRWAEEINAAITGDASKVEHLAAWCRDSGGDDDLIALLEDRGRIVSRPTAQEIAKIIYEDRQLKAVLSLRNVDVYIPTYQRGA